MSQKRRLEGWEFASAPAGTDEEGTGLVWRPARVPGTAASSLFGLGELGFAEARDLDAETWWFRCRFPDPARAPGHRTVLGLEGLATHATVFLNREGVLTSDNMFLAHEVDVTERLGADNELLLRFAALGPRLLEKRPRPRWKTRLVSHQQLRWHRTTLLGRMPGWSPPLAPVGPWRPVWLEDRGPVALREVSLGSSLVGDDGRVVLEAALVLASGESLREVTLHVGEVSARVACTSLGGGLHALRAELMLPSVARWWPHTHGPSPLYPAHLVARLESGETGLPLGRLGFRSVQARTRDSGFALEVNGRALFCRGACWTPLDMTSLGGSEEQYRAALETVRAAGMNMLRVPGTMIYESDAFYALCDELGILVWQDFMFANMDYPVGDEAFGRSAREEAAQLLRRIGARPSLAVLCGNSEVAQQVAMLGLPPEPANNDFFTHTLPALVSAGAPGVPYLPSTPSGGAMPFQVDAGVGHYYGVGAYRRPLEDARRANVRFAPECLAFSHVPSERQVEALLGNLGAAVHHPAWKARVPRDAGAGWDFEDVRDHYLALLFAVDPLALRASDPERYLAMGRVVTGEVVAATLAEWRREASTCRGALLWFLRDLWPGAGFGVLDSEGTPKAAYWYARRACLPLAVALTDEGVNGLVAHVFNDGPEPFEGALGYAALREEGQVTRSGGSAVHLGAHAQTSLHIEGLLGTFSDSAYAYRFGPAPHDLARLDLLDSHGQRIASAFHFPTGMPSRQHEDVGLEVLPSARADGHVQLELRTRSFAQSVSLELEGFRPSDDFFHVCPGQPLFVELRRAGKNARLRGTAQPLNSRKRVSFSWDAASGA